MSDINALVIAGKMVGADNIPFDLANEIRAVDLLVNGYWSKTAANNIMELKSTEVIAMIIVNYRRRKK